MMQIQAPDLMQKCFYAVLPINLQNRGCFALAMVEREGIMADTVEFTDPGH